MQIISRDGSQMKGTTTRATTTLQKKKVSQMRSNSISKASERKNLNYYTRGTFHT